MVGKFVEIENTKIVVKPVCFHTKPLRDIIDFYPETYDKVIYYFHCMVSLNPHDNPFADLSQADKEEKIIRYLGIDIDIDNPIIKEGLDCFKECYTTSIYRSYSALKSLLDQVNLKLESVQIDFGKEGNSANINGVVKALSTYKKEMKEAKKDYLEEQGDIRGRGGVELAYDEMDDEDEDDDYVDDNNNDDDD